MASTQHLLLLFYCIRTNACGTKPDWVLNLKEIAGIGSQGDLAGVVRLESKRVTERQMASVQRGGVEDKGDGKVTAK